VKPKRTKVLTDVQMTEIAFRQIDHAINEAAAQERFRGEIWEFFKDVPMERGYANKGEPFDINTACYMREPMQEIRRRTHGKFVIRAAVQMLKTLGTIEQPAGYFIANDPGDMAIYLFGEDSAFDQAKARLMPFIKSEKTIADMIDRVMKSSPTGRFDITTAEFYLPGMVLRIWPANESSTQRITLRYVLVSDAFLSKKTGILKQAIARTTQHNSNTLKDYKVIIESQGGEDDDDFDEEWKTTDQRMLHVRCPYCGSGQPFEWHRKRLGGFKSTLPKSVLGSGLTPEQLEIKAAELTKELTATDRKDCGMKRGPEELIKRKDGSYDEKQILKLTYYECFHCGSAWHDTPEIRKLIDESSYYVPSNPNALEDNIGFSWPAWAGQRLAWGGELIMLEFLQATESKRKTGNDERLKQWYQKRAAISWNENIDHVTIPSVTATVNPKNSIPNELFRSMEVDCQKDKQLSAIKGEDMTGHFWVTAFATDQGGNDVQLWRGYCTSWDEWIAKYRELGIPVMNVSIDASYKPDEVKAMAARNHQINCSACGHEFKDGKPDCKCGADGIIATWMMMRGSDQHSFQWDDGKRHEFRFMRPEEATVWDKSGGSRTVNVPVVEWSNFRFKSILDLQRQRTQGMPAMTVLPDNSELLSERTRIMEAMEKENYSWDNQMNSEMPSKMPGKKATYVALHKENHYRDCCCMQKVRKLQAGVLGTHEVVELEAQKAYE
jgi:hypothetical protein